MFDEVYALVLEDYLLPATRECYRKVQWGGRRAPGRLSCNWMLWKRVLMVNFLGQTLVIYLNVVLWTPYNCQGWWEPRGYSLVCMYMQTKTFLSSFSHLSWSYIRHIIYSNYCRHSVFLWNIFCWVLASQRWLQTKRNPGDYPGLTEAQLCT